MDLRKIKKLIELVEESGISELEVKHGDETIRIARARNVAMAPPVQTQTVAAAAADGRAVTDGHIVTAPISGTFYRSPAPGEAPFVSTGQTVAVGDILCIIESMKMMNQILAERAGAVVEVLPENGQPLEAGTPLFRIV